jgi:hypothetical protein
MITFLLQLLIIGEHHTPLNHLAKHTSPSAPLNKNAHPSDMQAEFVACNSILSEFGVLGFEGSLLLILLSVSILSSLIFSWLFIRES